MQYLRNSLLWERGLSIGISTLIFSFWGAHSSAKTLPKVEPEAITVKQSLTQRSGSLQETEAGLSPERSLPPTAKPANLPRQNLIASTAPNGKPSLTMAAAIGDSFSHSLIPQNPTEAIPKATVQPISRNSPLDTERWEERLITQWDGLDSAINAYRQILAAHPNNTEAYLNLGILYFHQGNYRQAILTYLPALALVPDNPNIHLAIGATYLQMGHYEASVDFLQRAAQLAPTQANIQELLSLALQLRHQPKSDSYLQGTFTPPQDMYVYLQLGDLAWSYGDLDDALRFYQLANAIQPGHQEIQVRLADLRILQQASQNGMYSYQSVGSISPEDPQELYNLGIMLARQGEPTQARTVFEAALELFHAQNNISGIQRTIRMLKMF